MVLEARRNGGPVRWAFPHYLVEQRLDLVALYLPIGTRGLAPADRHAVLRGDPPLPHVWHSHDVLRLVTPGAWHSVDCFSAEGGRFAGWYVNFQVPIERRGDRFVTCDLELDIWVEPDRSWSWKDRDEYRQLIGLGLVTAAEAAAIEAEAEAVLARVQRASPPFDGSWSGWRPDPAWGPLTLPVTRL